MILNIDRTSAESVFRQLITQISSLIDSGELKEGYQMPSSRQLAETLAVNRSTVIRAYDELWALGYLESTPGSYTRVRKRIIKKRDEKNFPNNTMFWNEKLTKNYLPDYTKTENFSSIIAQNEESVISFEKFEPDARLIDNSAIRRCFKEALSYKGHKIYGYCSPRGFEPLRQSIISHMRLHGVKSNDENILITNGSQNSLQLIFQSFIAENDIIAVESPTYPLLYPIAKYYNCKILEIPIKEDGMDMAILIEYIQFCKIKMVYTMPTFHNPTSVTMSQSKREELLSICEKHSILIIEDSTEEEMKYFGKVHLPIKSLDAKGIVIYLGSFSKILAPGFRLGWIIADSECIRRLTSLKTIFDISSNSISQIVLHNFCKEGYYELHIRKLQRAYKSRMRTALKALKNSIPANKASWIEPIGGFLIWLRLNIKPIDIDIERHFRNFGVKVIDGKRFFYSSTKEYYIRISISKSNETEIEEGIKRIAMAISDLA